jgi:hypothetical protein
LLKNGKNTRVYAYYIYTSPQVQMWVTITLLNNKEKIADIDGNGLVYKVFGLYTKEGFLLELSLT